jgi:alkylation response protein AidB-like acyl-CoA dehydrogenase
MTTATQTDVAHYIEKAHEIAALLADAGDRIDSERRIPEEITNRMADEGLFRLLIPKSLGGAELAHPDFRKIVSIFAEVDGSAGWCVNQNNVFSTNSARVPEETAHEVWTVQRNVVTNGPPMPYTRADVVDGGYRISGRWNFSSGIPHATWVAALTPVYQPGQNEPSEMRTMLLPKGEVSVLDVWNVGGLRGTGSHSFEVQDAFIPAARSYPTTADSREPGPLYYIPTTLLFCSGFATVALGAARAGLDSAIELAVGKTQMGRETTMRDESTTQRMVGEAEAIWNAARAFLDESTNAMWEGVCRSRDLTTEERIRVRLSSTHAIRQAAKVVDIAYTLCGSSAIFAINPIQRKFQDVHAITQQIQGRPTHYDTAGQFYLGLEPGGIF